MSLGNRVLIYILVLGTLAASLYGYFFLRQERRYAETQVQKRIQAFGESMREILQANLASENLNPLKKLLNRIAVFEQPMGVRIFFKSGEAFYQTKSLKSLPPGDISSLVSSLGENDSIVEKMDFHGKALLVCSLPIESKNGSLLGILQVFDSQSAFSGELRIYQRKVFTALMLFCILTLTIIFFVIQRGVNRPMASLLKEVRPSPASRQNGHEISVIKQEFKRRDSHLQELETVLSHSSREKEALRDQLKQSEKMAAIGKFAAGLAHEMGSPLSVIEGRGLQALRKIGETEMVEKNLTLVVEQSRRLSRMIHDVLTFARRRPLNRSPLDLNLLLTRSLELVEDFLGKVRLQKNLSPKLPRVEGDPDQMLQVFTNLLRNALQAMPDAGLPTSETGPVLENGNPLPWIRVSITDTGVGMDEEVRSRIFEPFFSRRSDGERTGLGLSIVYGIIQEHQGRILVESRPREGSRFDIYLPVEQEEESHKNSGAPWQNPTPKS